MPVGGRLHVSLCAHAIDRVCRANAATADRADADAGADGTHVQRHVTRVPRDEQVVRLHGRLLHHHARREAWLLRQRSDDVDVLLDQRRLSVSLQG